MRIHILGASGSGTTTLGKALSSRLGYPHFDTDDYFWQPSDPPFQKKRSIEARYQELDPDLESSSFVLSGSLCGWGDKYIEKFDYVIFLHIPSNIRMSRLMCREVERYGNDIKPLGRMHESHLEFMAWNKRYDTAGMEQRSYKLHLKWLEQLDCRVITIDGVYTIKEIIDSILKEIHHD